MKKLEDALSLKCEQNEDYYQQISELADENDSLQNRLDDQDRQIRDVQDHQL